MRIVLVEQAGASGELRSRLAQQGYDVIHAPILDRVCLQRLGEIAESLLAIDVAVVHRGLLQGIADAAVHKRPIVVFTREGEAAELRACIHAGASAVVVNGLYVSLAAVFATAIAHYERMQALQAQVERVVESMHERNAIERAKGILMRRRNVAEARAYAALCDMATGRGQRLRDAAQAVIQAEEMLARS